MSRWGVDGVTASEQGALELPGLEPPAAGSSAMVKAAHTTIRALEAAGKLAASDAMLTQLLLELAGAIDRGRAAGRASAVAMAARELRDTLLMLDPPPEAGAAGDKAKALLEQFVAAAELAANNGGVVPDGWQLGAADAAS